MSNSSERDPYNPQQNTALDNLIEGNEQEFTNLDEISPYKDSAIPQKTRKSSLKRGNRNKIAQSVRVCSQEYSSQVRTEAADLRNKYTGNRDEQEVEYISNGLLINFDEIQNTQQTNKSDQASSKSHRIIDHSQILKQNNQQVTMTQNFLNNRLARIAYSGIPNAQYQCEDSTRGLQNYQINEGPDADAENESQSYILDESFSQMSDTRRLPNHQMPLERQTLNFEDTIQGVSLMQTGLNYKKNIISEEFMINENQADRSTRMADASSGSKLQVQDPSYQEIGIDHQILQDFSTDKEMKKGQRLQKVGQKQNNDNIISKRYDNSQSGLSNVRARKNLDSSKKRVQPYLNQAQSASKEDMLITINGSLQNWVLSDLLQSSKNQKAIKQFQKRQNLKEAEIQKKLNESRLGFALGQLNASTINLQKNITKLNDDQEVYQTAEKRKSLMDYIPFAKSIASFFSTQTSSKTQLRKDEPENELENSFKPDWMDDLTNLKVGDQTLTKNVSNIVKFGDDPEVSNEQDNAKRVRRQKNMVGKFTDQEIMNDTQKWSLEHQSQDNQSTPACSTRIFIQPKKPLNQYKNLGESFSHLSGAQSSFFLDHANSLNSSELYKNLEQLANQGPESCKNLQSSSFLLQRSMNMPQQISSTKRLRNIPNARKLIEAPSELWHIDSDLIDVDLGDFGEKNQEKKAKGFNPKVLRLNVESAVTEHNYEKQEELEEEIKVGHQNLINEEDQYEVTFVHQNKSQRGYGKNNVTINSQGKKTVGFMSNSSVLPQNFQKLGSRNLEEAIATNDDRAANSNPLAPIKYHQTQHAQILEDPNTCEPDPFSFIIPRGQRPNQSAFRNNDSMHQLEDIDDVDLQKLRPNLNEIYSNEMSFGEGKQNLKEALQQNSRARMGQRQKKEDDNNNQLDQTCARQSIMTFHNESI